MDQHNQCDCDRGNLGIIFFPGGYMMELFIILPVKSITQVQAVVIMNLSNTHNPAFGLFWRELTKGENKSWRLFPWQHRMVIAATVQETTWRRIKSVPIKIWDAAFNCSTNDVNGEEKRKVHNEDSDNTLNPTPSIYWALWLVKGKRFFRKLSDLEISWINTNKNIIFLALKSCDFCSYRR